MNIFMFLYFPKANKVYKKDQMYINKSQSSARRKMAIHRHNIDLQQNLKRESFTVWRIV